MEQNKKSGLLLVAGILGLIGVILWVWAFSSLLSSFSSGLSESGWNPDLSLIERIKGGIAGAGGAGMFLMAIWMFILAPLSALAAFALNILGWVKGGAKQALAAGILYLVSLNIPSAILCFIGFSKLNKQAV